MLNEPEDEVISECNVKSHVQHVREFKKHKDLTIPESECRSILELDKLHERQRNEQKR